MIRLCNTLLYCAVLIIISLFLIGWYKDLTTEYTTHYEAWRVEEGQTMWVGASRYFKQQDKYRTYDEFLYAIKTDPRNKEVFSKKWLQPNDVVYIPIDKVVKQ